MLRIRFKRAGKIHQSAYRVVVSERARTPLARAKEDIGWYNPHSKEAGIDKDRAKYWLSVGAQPSDTVHNLFIKQGIMEGKKIAVHSQPKKSEEDLAKEAEAAKSEGNEGGAVSEVGDKTEAEEVPAEEKAGLGEEAAPVEEAKAEEAKEEDKAEETPTEENKES